MSGKLNKQKAIAWLETEGRYYTQAECAAHLGVSKQRVEQMIRAHAIPRPIRTLTQAIAEIRRLQGNK